MNGYFLRFIFLIFFHVSAFSASGDLFVVTSSGTALPQAVSITLCLNINGNSPLSCQNYSVANTNLTIRTTIPNRTYHFVGIRVNAANYAFTPGSANGLGFIPLGSMSATQAVSGSITSPAAVVTMPYYLYVVSGSARAVFTYGVDSLGQLKSLSLPSASTALNPQYITVNPAATYAYVPCFDVAAISMFSINKSTGQLTSLSPATVATGGGPHNIAITPTGVYAYAPSFAPAVYMYSLNQSSGQLAALTPATISAGNGAQYATINPAGTYAYVVNINADTVSMYSINQSTGQLTALSTPTVATGRNPIFIAINPAGTYAYVANSRTSGGGNTISMYSINQSTGVLTALPTPTIATGSQPFSIAIHPAGTYAYVNNQSSNTVSMYSINQSTGQLTALSTPTIATGTAPRYIVINPAGTYVYVANSGARSISMYSVNQSTGVLTALSPSTFTVGGNGPYGMAMINAST